MAARNSTTSADGSAFQPPPRSSFVLQKGSKSALLNVLSEVKSRIQDKLGVVDFPMPQFILIGSQSVGKSRLVESIAGEQFNFVSGTLGSRRPTILEFRNVATAKESKWYVMDDPADPTKYVHHTMPEVMAIVGKAHQDLGQSVTATPINVRVESALCPDMQIVDLPGYRGYSSNEQSKSLAAAIVDLNQSFLADPRNTILCVEEAGDAANLSSLSRVREVDPGFKRTILVRNKLDKYYGDLTSVTVDKWLEGMGDLPKNLKKFALTLPHWQETQPPPKRLDQLRTDMNKQDIDKMNDMGAGELMKATVGWSNFASYMEKKTEQMFVAAVGPVLQNLKQLMDEMDKNQTNIAEELDNLDESKMLATVRTCGISFSQCLTFVMEGYIRSDRSRMTLDEELRAFIAYHETLGSIDQFSTLPSEEFQGIDDYIDYLKKEAKVPAFDVAINGGAQFRRLMYEVEVFLRFSEIGEETKKRDVMQGLGVSLGSITWREVVVKLLNHDAHLPLQRRVKYVGERIKWFFMQQKEPIVEFMSNIKGSPDEKLYSILHTKNAALLQANAAIRQLVFETYDRVTDRQLDQFMALFKNTLHATFSNPWVFPKNTTDSSSFSLEDQAEEPMLPSFDDTKDRIKDEIQNRTGTERTVQKWIYDIPMEAHKLDDAVDQVQMLVMKVYSHIRSQICDQVELFAESFFKMPLMRRLEEDMMQIELSDVDKECNRARREQLKVDKVATTHGLHEVTSCHRALADFALQHRAHAGQLPNEGH